MSVYKNTTHRIIYTARGSKTGLTDVKIHIWDPTPTKVVDGDTMTELGEGLYYYDYKVTKTGIYQYKIDSASNKLVRTGSIEVINNPWEEELSDYKTHGTFGYKLQHISSSFARQPRFTGVFNKEDKEKLYELLTSIDRRLADVESRVEANAKAVAESIKATLLNTDNINKISKEISTLKQESSNLKETIELRETEHQKEFREFKNSTNKNLEQLARLYISNLPLSILKNLEEEK